MEQQNQREKHGLLRTFFQTVGEIKDIVHEEFPHVAPTVKEELTKIVEETKEASNIPNILGILEERTKGIGHAIKTDIEEKVMTVQKQIRRQFFYQWVVIIIGISVAIVIALLQ